MKGCQKGYIRIVKNAQAGGKRFDKGHNKPKETPLPAPKTAQNAVLDRFQQPEVRKDIVNDKRFDLGEIRRKSSVKF